MPYLDERPVEEDLRLGPVQQIVTNDGRKASAAARASEHEGEEAEYRFGAEFAPLLATGTISEVIRPLKSGKEATVWLCRAGRGELLAAKVYAAREARGRRGHATYDDGRQFLDARAARAVRSRSSFGRDVEQGRWMSREYERLVQLHEAGVAIPRPIELSDRLILMEYVGNIDMPAPRLRDVRLDAAEARSALRWVLYDVELMLGANVVHADLSAFNVLWWEGRTKIIDFPQAVDPRFNRNAKMLLERDIRNVCDYFARSGAPADANAIARDLWRRWLRAEL